MVELSGKDDPFQHGFPNVVFILPAIVVAGLAVHGGFGVAMKKSKEGRCQCCNNTLTENSHLVFGDEGRNFNIATLLFNYIKKTLNENDGIKYAICDSCWQQLIQYNEFQQKCIRANEMACEEDEEEMEEEGVVSEEGDDDNNGTVIVQQNMQNMGSQSEVGIFYGNGQSQSNTNNFGYECKYDEELDDMQIEYLDENDILDEENWCTTQETPNSIQPSIDGLTKLPFDFTPVLVKPIFLLGIANADDLMRVKQKICTGIPCHAIEMKLNSRRAKNQSLDVEKIVTSDDLINILEDDYHNENAYTKKIRDCDEPITQLIDAQHTDISEYLKAIASLTYEQSYENYINCMLCTEVIMSQQHLVYHINESHSLGDQGVLCIFDVNCPPLSDLITMQEHMFNEHMDSIPTQLCLTCQTCESNFKSSVQFGKHMCLTIDDEGSDFQCASCDKKLSSRKRYLFHMQFHLENARPKICIICELIFQNEESFYNHVMFSHERVFEYYCCECDKSFSSNLRLELHTRTHHTKRTIKCNSCDKTFVDKSMLDEHISSKHSLRAEKPLECSVCKKVYNRSSRLRKHMTTHERMQKNAVLICEPCAMAFATIDEIDEHFQRQHDDDHVNIVKKEILFVVCCEYCENAFVDNHKLVKHKECHLNDDKPFKCGFCMASYETYSKLKTHKNTHTNQQVKFPVQRHYMCDVEDCWKRYRHWSDLLNHRKTVHLINPSIFKCNDCEQTFYQSWNFSYHKKTVHAMATIQCQQCDYQCKNIYNLRAHQKKFHSDKNEEKPPSRDVAENQIVVKQEEADTVTAIKAKAPETISSSPSSSTITTAEAEIATTPTKTTLEIDQYVRKVDKTIICNICEKQLATRCSARSHIEMIHFKIKNFACTECGKTFYLKKDATDHLRTHTAETPYDCTICDKKFRTASILNGHQKTHSNNRPHICPYCSAKFKRAYVLKNHIKQHIGVRGFPCTVPNCKKEYRTQWELNSHSRSKHSKPESTDNIEYTVQIEYNNSNDQISSDLTHSSTIVESNRTEGAVTKRKHRNRAQQIIYVMPGPDQ